MPILINERNEIKKAEVSESIENLSSSHPNTRPNEIKYPIKYAVNIIANDVVICLFRF